VSTEDIFFEFKKCYIYKQIDETRLVFCASCGCSAGAGAKCKHIAAVGNLVHKQ